MQDMNEEKITDISVNDRISITVPFFGSDISIAGKVVSITDTYVKIVTDDGNIRDIPLDQINKIITVKKSISSQVIGFIKIKTKERNIKLETFTKDLRYSCIKNSGLDYNSLISLESLFMYLSYDFAKFCDDVTCNEIFFDDLMFGNLGDGHYQLFSYDEQIREIRKINNLFDDKTAMFIGDFVRYRECIYLDDAYDDPDERTEFLSKIKDLQNLRLKFPSYSLAGLYYLNRCFNFLDFYYLKSISSETDKTTLLKILAEYKFYLTVKDFSKDLYIRQYRKYIGNYDVDLCDNDYYTHDVISSKYLDLCTSLLIALKEFETFLSKNEYSLFRDNFFKYNSLDSSDSISLSVLVELLSKADVIALPLICCENKDDIKNLKSFFFAHFLFYKSSSFLEISDELLRKQIFLYFKPKLKSASEVLDNENSGYDTTNHLSSLYYKCYIYFIYFLYTSYRHGFPIRSTHNLQEFKIVFNSDKCSLLFLEQDSFDVIKEFFNDFIYIFPPCESLPFEVREERYLNKFLKYRDNNPFTSFPTYEFLDFFLKYAIRNLYIFSLRQSFDFYFPFFSHLTIQTHDDSISVSNNMLHVPLSVANDFNSATVYLESLSIIDESGLPFELDLHSFRLPTGKNFNILVDIPLSSFEYCNASLDFDVSLKYKRRSSINSFVSGNFEYSYRKDEIPASFHFEFDSVDAFHGIKNNYFNYKSGSVVEDDQMFFGRSKDIDNILQNMRDITGKIITNRCVCIYGQTRTGKSSILYHLKCRLRSDQHTIIVDLGDLGCLDLSDDSFRFMILTEIAREVKFEHRDLYKLLVSEGFDVNPDDSAFEKSPALYFDSYLRNFKRILAHSAPDVQTVILADEFTYIYDWIKMGTLSENFMRFWKGLLQNYGICAVIIGQDHMPKFINDPRFINCFGAIRTQEVTYLSFDDARELVKRPVSPEKCGEHGCVYSCDAVDYLVDITCGSAYLLMNICSDFIEYLNRLHVQNATRVHAEDFIRNNISCLEERLFEPLFNDKMNLDSASSVEENKRLLKIIAHGTENTESIRLKDMNLSANDLIRLNNLRDRHVLVVDNDGCHIAVKLYAMWLRRMTERPV